MTDSPNGEAVNIGIDDIDARILGLLVKNARLSVRAVARHVGMSPNAISERLGRLEQRRIILGYFTELNPQPLGFGMLAIVGLQTVQGPPLEETIAQILRVPEIEAAHIVTGQWDLILEMRVRDQEHLRQVLLESIWRLQAFRHSETMIALSSYVRHGSWAPPAIRDQGAS